MQPSQHILPVARSFYPNETFDWQIHSQTGISCDYANNLGLNGLFISQAMFQTCQELDNPVEIEGIATSCQQFLECIRRLPSYSEYIRDRIELNSTCTNKKRYIFDDFICKSNIQNVRKIEELAGKIREAAQPTEEYEADLTTVLNLINEATSLIYVESNGPTREQTEDFVELFCEMGILVK